MPPVLDVRTPRYLQFRMEKGMLEQSRPNLGGMKIVQVPCVGGDSTRDGATEGRRIIDLFWHVVLWLSTANHGGDLGDISLANVRHHWEKGTMAEFIHEHTTRLKGEDGMTYIVRIYAQERIDGTWAGWLEFHPTDEGKPVLRTEQETSQPNRMAVEYWASGLEPIYLEGAFTRSQGRLL